MSGAFDYLVIVSDFWQNQAPVDLFDENPRVCRPMVKLTYYFQNFLGQWWNK